MSLREDNTMEYWGNSDPKCPYCDHDIDINDNELWELYEEGEHAIDCPSCGKHVAVVARARWSLDTDWSFDTDQQEDDE